MNKFVLYRKELDLLNIVKEHLNNFDLQLYIEKVRSSIQDLFYDNLYSLKPDFIDLLPIEKISETRNLLDFLKSIIAGKTTIYDENKSKDINELSKEVDELINLMKNQLKLKGNTKVFYSWQSDTNQNDNHYFIRDCLDKAIKQINNEKKEIYLTLDSDTKNIAGSPNIIETILNKIDDSYIFIGDITPIRKAHKDLMPNPNVMFELGYAENSITNSNIILILNEKYGKVEKLPFDIRSKRILRYRYSSDIDDKKTAIANLSNDLKNAINRIIEN